MAVILCSKIIKKPKMKSYLEAAASMMMLGLLYVISVDTIFMGTAGKKNASVVMRREIDYAQRH